MHKRTENDFLIEAIELFNRGYSIPASIENPKQLAEKLYENYKDRQKHLNTVDETSH